MKRMFEVLARAIVIHNDMVLLANVKGKKWYFLPGGHVEYGESALKALERELKEEIKGARFSVQEAVGMFENIYSDIEDHHEYTLLFNTTIDCPEKMESNEEKLEFHFHKIKDLDCLDIRPSSLIDNIKKWYIDKKVFLNVLLCR